MTKRLLIVLLGALLLSGCHLWDDLFGTSKENAQSSPAPAPSGSPASECNLTPEQREALVDLVLTPQACSDTEPCPTGSFCDAEHNHTCNWQCLANSDCGTGTCRCDGTCSNSPPSTPPGDGASASCPRDAELLDSIKSNFRHCEWDDECPYGAHCDRSVGHCDFSCRDPDQPCGRDETCDCAGRCVTADAPPERPAQRLPKLEVDPLAITVNADPSDTEWERTITVRLSTEDPDLLSGSGDERTFDASLDIVAGEHLGVACDTSASAPTFSAACTLDGDGGHWIFHREQTRWTALQTLRVKPLEVSTLVAIDRPDPFTIRIYSPLVEGSPRLVGVAFGGATTPSAWDPVAPTTFSEKATFSGTLVLSPAADLDAAQATIQKDVPPVELPIEAAILPNCNIDGYLEAGPCLLLHDPLHVLSKGSLMRLPLDGSVLGFPVVGSGPGIGGVDHGRGFELVNLLLEARTGSLSGALTRSDDDGDVSSVASFTLSPKETESCASDADCRSGDACVLGTFCGSNAEVFPGPDPTPPIYHAAMKTWADSKSRVLETTVSTPGFIQVDGLGMRSLLYDASVGVGAPSSPGLFAGRGFLGRESMAIDLRNHAEPHELCDFSLRRIIELGGRRFPEITDAELEQSLQSACANVSRSAGWSSAVACVGSAGSFPYNAPEGSIFSCANVYANIRAKNPSLPANYFDQCRRITFELSHVGSGTAFAVPLDTWLCPDWENTAFPQDFTGQEEADLCYPRAQQAGIGSNFYSSFLDRGAHPLAFSGDLPCLGVFRATHPAAPASNQDPAVLPSGVDLVVHRDLVSPSAGAAELFASCVADLSRSPDGIVDVHQLFSAGTCFSPASFFSAVDALRIQVESRTASEPAMRLLLRLVQQWAELQAFVANQGRQDLEIPLLDGDETLPGSDEGAPAITLSRLLDQLGQGAVLALAQPWAAIPDRLLRSPNYRTLAFGLENAEWEEQYGPAPALLEFTTAYFNVLELHARQAALTAYQARLSGARPTEVDAAVAKFGDGMRLALELERLSTNLYRHAFEVEVACGSDDDCALAGLSHCAEGVCSESTWASRWVTARDALSAARNRALVMGAALASGQSPLGVSENDLPLFFGDLTGTNSRFFASSDYLMSTWAVSAVQTARGALEDARSAWLSQRNSKIQDSLLAADRDRRLETIRNDAGQAVATACGLSADTTPDQILDRIAHEGLDLDRCYVVPSEEDPSCVVTPDAQPQGFDTAAFLACFQAKAESVRDSNLEAADFFRKPCHGWFRDHVPGNENPSIDVWAINNYGPVVGCVGSCGGSPRDAFIGYFTPGAAPPTFAQSFIDDLVRDQNRLGLRACSGPLWDSLNAEFIPCAEPEPLYECAHRDDTPTLCLANKHGDGLPLRPAVKSLTCHYSDYLTDRNRALGAYDLTVQQSENVRTECLDEQHGLGAGTGRVRRSNLPLQCFRGGLGSTALRVLKAQQEADLVDILWAEKQLEYKIQAQACNALQGDARRLELANASFLEELASLQDAHNTIGSFSDAFSGVVEIVSGAGADSAAAQNGQASSGRAGIAGASAGSGLLFGSFARDIESKMTALNAQHQAFLQEFAQEEAVRACFVEADKIRSTFNSAKERIIIQATEASDALVEFDNLLTSTKRAVANGSAQLAREQGRAYGGYAFHYWYDEKVSRFQREFTWAKRLVFLTMRAVEYEFQQTLPLRQEILTAIRPDQLEGALQSLQQEVATRAINRRRPEQASVVVSLRDDVLGLHDRTQAESGERAFSSSLIFRSRLWDPRYAIRDKSGNYLGQGIPFALAPQGTLVNRCAERLWRVTATLQGDGLSETEPGAPVVLFKANTFSSQWCSGHEDPERPFEVGVIQPSRNLFKDPESLVDPSDDAHYSAASLYPWFNVRRADFFRKEYQEGASEELAGRGLYGDYVLMFPRELLEGKVSAVPPPNGEIGVSIRDEKFPLDHVEDVLLRLDYLSVDNYPDIGN